MKLIKVSKEIQSTCADTLQLEVEKLSDEGWQSSGDMYIDTAKGQNNKKYKMTTIKLIKEIFC